MTREIVRDLNAQPIENLLPKPSMERFAAGASLLRRNLIPNSQPAASTTGFAASSFGTGGAGVADRVQGATPNGDGWGFVKTWTTSPSSGSGLGYTMNFGGIVGDASTRAAIKPGLLYTLSAWLKSPVDCHYSLQGIIQATDGSSVSIAAGANVYLTAEKWTPLYCTFRAPAGSATIRGAITKVNGPPPPVGGQLAITWCLLEDRPIMLPYFWGGMQNTRGIAYSFEGTANASPSTARALLQEHRRNYAMNPDAKASSAAYQIQAPTGYNCRSVPETGTGNANDSAYAMAVDSGNAAAAAFRMRIGGVATPISPALNASTSVPLYVAFDYWASSLVAGKAHTLEFPIRGPGIANGAVNFQNFAAFTPVAGWNRIELLTTLVPKSTMTGIDQFEHPQIVTPGVVVPDGTTLFRVGRVGVEMVASRPGDHFSGNETPDADMTPAFVGTVDSSASTLSVPLVDGYGGMNVARVASQQYPGELRVLPTTAANDSCARVDLLPYVQEGQIYTVLAKLKIRSPHSSAYAAIQGTQRRSLFLDITGGGAPIRGWGATNPSPNTPGEYVHRITFAVPAVPGSPVTGLGARLYNGAPLGDASMFWDEAMLVRGVYTGPYLDGDKFSAIWRGTPHDSASIGYPHLVAIGG